MHAYLSGNMRRDVYVHVVCTISCRPLVKVCVYVCVWTDAARVMPALHLMDLRACEYTQVLPTFVRNMQADACRHARVMGELLHHLRNRHAAGREYAPAGAVAP